MGGLPINKFVAQLMQAPPQKLVFVSLGNPTAQLANTRHNAGHIVMDRLIEELGGLSTDPALVTQNENVYMAPLALHPRIFMAKSRTYMNHSGRAVVDAMKVAQHNSHRLCVIHDDIDTLNGIAKFKLESRAMGAHGGLNDISKRYPNAWTRIRIGIGSPANRAHGTVASYVLKKFPPAERAQLDEEVFPQVLEWMQRIAKAMAPRKPKRPRPQVS